MDTLAAVVSPGESGLSMSRLTTILKKLKRQILAEMESEPESYFSQALIEHFLYGDRASSVTESSELQRHLNIVQFVDELLSQPAYNQQFWIDFIKTNMIASKRFVVIGKPDFNYSTQLALEEEERVAEQTIALSGDAGDVVDRELSAALATNAVPPPASVINSVPFANATNLKYLSVVTARPVVACISEPGTLSLSHHTLFRSGSASAEFCAEDSQLQEISSHLVKDGLSVSASTGPSLPFFVQFNNVSPSQFVSISLYLDNTALTVGQLQYLELYLECMFECDQLRGGVIVPRDTVVSQLMEDSVSYHNSIGIGGSYFTAGGFSSQLNVSFKFELTMYLRAVEWCRRVLFEIIFTKERVITSAKKLKSKISALKREGSFSTSTIINVVDFDPHCCIRACNINSQQRFLDDVIEGKSEDVVEELVLIKSILTRPSNIKVHIAGDLMSIPNPVAPWR
jgi:Zn-dependent M16 (insulinase) family peptidase